MSTKVVTPEAVLSFPNLFSPRPPRNDGDKPKYGCALLFKKQADRWQDDPGLEHLRAALAAEVNAEWPSKDKRPKIKWPILDGDEENYAGYEGHWYIRCNSIRRPTVVGPDPSVEIIDAEELYAGAIVKAQVDAFTYNRPDSKGVTFGIEMLQKRRDGERIDGGGRAKAADVFDAVEGAAPAAPAGDLFD
jgi:hypothetical protein